MSSMATLRETPLALFMEAHLPTDAEWRVFAVIAGARDEVWTAAAAARDANVSDHEADQALRRFSAAGIVERFDDPGHPRRYRWQPSMDYLNARTEPLGARDPVCGMPVAPDSPHVVEDGDERVVFCSMPCLVRWRHGHRLHPGGRRP